jgi:hypothetical protein
MIDPPWSLPVGFSLDYAPMENCALLPNLSGRCRDGEWK